MKNLLRQIEVLNKTPSEYVGSTEQGIQHPYEALGERLEHEVQCLRFNYLTSVSNIKQLLLNPADVKDMSVDCIGWFELSIV